MPPGRVWSLGATGTETLFSGGARPAAVAAARATYDQSVASYRQTVLTAFQQVEDALSSLRILEQQAAAEAIAVASTRRSGGHHTEPIPREAPSPTPA